MKICVTALIMFLASQCALGMEHTVNLKKRKLSSVTNDFLNHSGNGAAHTEDPEWMDFDLGILDRSPEIVIDSLFCTEELDVAGVDPKLIFNSKRLH